MNRVIILYAPDTPELKSASEKIKKAFKAGDFEVIVKPAKNGSIQDLAASDIVITGFSDAKKAIHPDFSEIGRALTGINLAGRIAALFTVDPAGSMDLFVKSFRDSDITIIDTPLIMVESKGSADKANEWVKKIISSYKDSIDARSI